MQSNTTVLPFIARVEVFDGGQWVPEAQGSTITWLREARDEAMQVYPRVRVVAWWGEEISVDGELGVALDPWANDPDRTTRNWCPDGR